MEFQSVYFATRKQVYLKFWTVPIEIVKFRNYSVGSKTLMAIIIGLDFMFHNFLSYVVSFLCKTF